MEETDGGEARATKKRRPRLLNIGIIILIVAACIGGTIIYQTGENSPIPKAIAEQANFRVYYPAKLPTGYKPQKDSTKFIDGVLFLTLSDGKNSITISQQQMPDPAPDLKWRNFKEISGSLGKIYFGKNGKQPTALAAVAGTFIAVSGTPDVQDTALLSTINDLKEID